MDEQKPKGAKAVGWLCIGLSIVLLALVIFKTAAGGDVNAALLLLAMRC